MTKDSVCIGTKLYKFAELSQDMWAALYSWPSTTAEVLRKESVKALLFTELPLGTYAVQVRPHSFPFTIYKVSEGKNTIYIRIPNDLPKDERCYLVFKNMYVDLHCTEPLYCVELVH